jgi:hypothetical protein
MNIKKIIVGFALSMLLGSGVAVAVDGNELLKSCSGEGKPMAFSYCLGLIKGVSTTMATYNVDPDATFLTACFVEEAYKFEHLGIVLRYLEDNPADLNALDVFLVIKAFLKAYPCN